MSPTKVTTTRPKKDVNAALRERTREVEVLHRISESISSTLDLESVLKHIVEVVVQVTKADSCLLYLVSANRDELVLRASKNPHPKLIGRTSLGLGEGITGWVAQEKVRVVIPRNASDDPRFRFFHNLPEDRYQAFVSLPIVTKGIVVGVINVQHKRTKRYQEAELALLSTIANQVGGAIENARLYEEMRRQALQLDTLSQVSETVASNRLIDDVLELIVTMTAEMMDSKICSLMLVDEPSGELRIAATQSLSEAYRRKRSLKIGQSISGAVVKEQRPIYVPDVTKEDEFYYRDLARREGLCSLLSVPMMIKDKVIGVLNVYTSKVHVFQTEEVKIIQAIANQSAVAIEHTRLMEKSFEMQEALTVRKLVERAKGHLMHSRKMTESEAFRLIQRQSMNLRKSMREIAEAIILAGELEGRSDR
ncbi:GAF and ANTAR domain-containing protein [Candidatus Nitronereus thalassa]|uniref:GAF and ANTAR domain-containing protein n=1 Tax=Candidatus Nitronereus thalassa TaxID=3020898 RepID=A0ABU3KBL8_9BACT|nr:GAF and ANTAR domain-containing protein [Candidatus Nitronereus thalassa]MDT7043815.1 GAF and ANTAR domain-containing protein [Candidatus Nitronereus thalassa]